MDERFLAKHAKNQIAKKARPHVDPACTVCGQQFKSITVIKNHAEREHAKPSETDKASQ